MDPNPEESKWSARRMATTVFNGARMISVEPIVFTMFFASGMLGPIEPRAMRTKCEELYMPDLDISTSGKELDDYIQVKVALWGMISEIPTIPISIISGALLGALSDHYGRQFLIVLPAGTEMLAYYLNLLVFSYVVDAPIWVLPISSWLSDVVGGPPTAQMSCAAFLADSTVDKDDVAVRMGYVQASKLLGIISGTFVISLCYSSLQFSSWFMIAMSINCAAVFWALYRIPQAKPKQLNETLKAIGNGEYGLERPKDGITVRHSVKDSAAEKKRESIVRMLWNLYKAAFKTLFQRRSGYKRLLVFLTMAIFCSLVLSIIEGQMSMGVYTMQRPLSWQPEQYAQWTYITKILDVIGTVVGIHVMKNWLKWPDTYVILVGLASTIAQIVPIVFVHYDWQMYLGSVLGMFDGVTRCGITSYGNHLLGPQEMGRFLTAGSILANLFVFSLHGFVLQPLYMATLDTFPGCYLLVTITTQVLTMILVVIVHVITVRTKAFESTEEENKKSDAIPMS